MGYQQVEYCSQVIDVSLLFQLLTTILSTWYPTIFLDDREKSCSWLFGFPNTTAGFTFTLSIGCQDLLLGLAIGSNILIECLFPLFVTERKSK